MKGPLTVTTGTTDLYQIVKVATVALAVITERRGLAKGQPGVAFLSFNSPFP